MVRMAGLRSLRGKSVLGVPPLRERAEDIEVLVDSHFDRVWLRKPLKEARTARLEEFELNYLRGLFRRPAAGCRTARWSQTLWRE